MNEVKFSIVIPTYNRAVLIPHTLESVFRQVYRNFEIIVVDNCSTDNTEEVLKPLIESNRIRYIRNDRNYERAYSRNVGFRNATGDYVTLLDSDDIMYPNCLADAADYIQKNPGTRFFHCLYDFIDEDYKPVSTPKAPSIENPFRSLMEGNFISNIAVFYRREVVEKVMFDESPILTGIEDYDFVIRVLAETKSLGRVNTVSAGILLHPNRSVNLERWETTYARAKYFIDKCSASPVFQETYGKYKHLLVTHLDLYLSGFLAVRGWSRKAFIFLMKAFWASPALIFNSKFWRHFLVIIKYFYK